MEFKIGERVIVKPFEDIPEADRTKGMGRVAGEKGEIVDKLYSEVKGCNVYKVHLDGYGRESACLFTERCLWLSRETEADYYYDIVYENNLAVVRMIESKDGEEREIAKGHGHIFHDGAYGIAQAVSYAMKRIAEELGGGSLIRHQGGTER